MQGSRIENSAPSGTGRQWTGEPNRDISANERDERAAGRTNMEFGANERDEWAVTSRQGSQIANLAPVSGIGGQRAGEPNGYISANERKEQLAGREAE